MFISDPTFFHPGSRVDKILDPDSHQRNKVFIIQKTHRVLKNKIPDTGSGFFLSRIPDPQIQGSKGTHPGSATLNIDSKTYNGENNLDGYGCNRINESISGFEL
jgi:hypothetical protein